MYLREIISNRILALTWDFITVGGVCFKSFSLMNLRICSRFGGLPIIVAMQTLGDQAVNTEQSVEHSNVNYGRLIKQLGDIHEGKVH